MNVHEIPCEQCGTLTPSYDLVTTGSIATGYRQLCSACFNREVAEMVGWEGFEHTRFAPVTLNDRQGAAHEFHFRSFLCGTGLVLEAFELVDGQPGGYHFSVLGDPEADPLARLAQLIDKMRQALAVQHLNEDDYGLRIADLCVRGRIECGEDGPGEPPCLVIDGRELTWDDFGRLLSSYEGWQFKLEIRDRTDEV